MARRTWNKEETYALIEEYEKHTILWDLKNDEHRNRELKNEAISSIALKFKCTEREIQRKIHNLRNQVSQELNKIKKKKRRSGTNEVYVSNWPYFLALQFLLPGLAHRPATSKAEDQEDTRVYGTERTQGEELQENADSIDKRINNSTESTGLGTFNDTIQRDKVEKRVSKRKYPSEDRKSKILKRATTISHGVQTEPDDNTGFGEYVAMELRSLQLDYNRRRLKSEIRKAITRIAEEDDNYSSATSMVPSSNALSSNHL